jgi:hypothetical protein
MALRKLPGPDQLIIAWPQLVIATPALDMEWSPVACPGVGPVPDPAASRHDGGAPRGAHVKRGLGCRYDRWRPPR